MCFNSPDLSASFPLLLHMCPLRTRVARLGNKSLHIPRVFPCRYLHLSYACTPPAAQSRSKSLLVIEGVAGGGIAITSKWKARFVVYKVRTLSSRLTFKLCWTLKKLWTGRSANGRARANCRMIMNGGRRGKGRWLVPVKGFNWRLEGWEGRRSGHWSRAKQVHTTNYYY